MSLPRYMEYKDSGIAWLGAVPRHWGVRRFKWLIERNDGGVWGDDPDGDGNTIVLRSTEQTVDGRWRIDNPAQRKLAERDRLSALLGVGDLLVTKSSGSALHIGKTTLVDEEVAVLRACYSNFMQRLRVSDQLSPKLAWYILNNSLARVQLDLLSNSTTGLANLNGTIIGELLLAVPPNDEQTAIVAFLDNETAKIDALIAEQEKLIALLTEKRQATISHAVTRGINPSARMKYTAVPWLGKVPAHWDVLPLKHFGRVGNGSTPNRDNPNYWAEEGFPWLNSSVVNQQEVTEAEQFVTETALKECHLPIIHPPAVLVGITGQGRTRGMATQLQFTATVNQHLAYIKPDTQRLSVAFLLCCLTALYDTLRIESEGAGSTKGAITCDQLGRLRIPVPALEEQHEIAAFLETETSKLDGLAADAGRAISLLKERRSALITTVITGQIDVRCVASKTAIESLEVLAA